MVNLCVVIVTYKQHYSTTRSYKSLKSLLDIWGKGFIHLIIYDNSSIPCPENIIESDANIVYVHDPRNKGVMPAYQYAQQYCVERSIEWILRLDQDSTFDYKLVEKFVKIIESNSNVAVVVPKIYCNNNIISPSFVNIGGLYTSIDRQLIGVPPKDITYINSMSFININNNYVKNALNTAVYMLDLSDHELSSKIPRTLVYVMDLEVLHDLSISNISGINSNRYKSLLKNEVSFMKSTQSKIGLLVFFIRLFVRLFKMLLYRRFDLAIMILKNLK